MGAQSPRRETEAGWVGVWDGLEGGGVGLHVKKDTLGKVPAVG